MARTLLPPIMRTPTLLVLSLALLLAGCTDGGDQDDDADLSSASVSEEDTQDTADCADGDATIAGAGSVDEGTMTVTVMDGAGNEVWSETYDDAFELEGETVDGGSGTWTIEAEPGDAFDGTFGLTLTCS